MRKGTVAKMTLLILFSTLFFMVLIIYNHASWGRAPKGERLERIKLSPNYRDGQFHNISATPQLTSKESKWIMMCEFLLEKNKNRVPNEVLFTQKSDLCALDIVDNVVVWFGHGSYFIQFEGKRFLVDPVLTKEFPMSLMFKPFEGSDIFKVEDIPWIDYLIITHDHWDHLDYGTLKALREKIGKVICPLGVGEYLECWEYAPKSIIEMDWHEKRKENDDLNIYCLPSRHFSGRGVFRNRTLWASFLLEGNGQKIFLSGDGGYDNHFKEIGELYGPLDLVILENGQYNMDWRYIHLMPELLEQTILDLKAKSVLTVHHSKYALARHDWDEPLNNIYKVKQRLNIDVFVPNIGESIQWK